MPAILSCFLKGEIKMTRITTSSLNDAISSLIPFTVGMNSIFRDLEQYRMIAFGGAMVLIMVFKPKGILANRKPTILMHGDKK